MSAHDFSPHHAPHPQHSQLHQIFGNSQMNLNVSHGSILAPRDLSTPSNSVTNNSIASSYRPRRKNTKPDLGFRHYPNDESSPHFGDDGSERHSRRKTTTRGHPSAINTIVIWLRNINKMRYIQISKAFFRWKYQSLYQTQVQSLNQTTENKTNEIGDSLDTSPEANHSSSTSSFLEQRNNYLQLFSENEKLREQVTEMKKFARQTERVVKNSCVRSMVVMIMRKRLLTKLRYYYDRWLNNTRLVQFLSDITHKQVELAVGLQQVESEREYVKQLEKANSQLKMSLFLTIFFYQWKSKTSLLLLNSEREKHEKQKTIIYQELAKIRKTIEEANQLEKVEVESAMMKGSRYSGSVNEMQNKLASLLSAGKQLRAQQQQQLKQQQQYSSPPPGKKSFVSSFPTTLNPNNNNNNNEDNLSTTSTRGSSGGDRGGGNGHHSSSSSGGGRGAHHHHNSHNTDSNSVTNSSHTTTGMGGGGGGGSGRKSSSSGRREGGSGKNRSSNNSNNSNNNY
jgi:hypothetical protein